jgi:hypothetical protein
MTLPTIPPLPPQPTPTLDQQLAHLGLLLRVEEYERSAAIRASLSVKAAAISSSCRPTV